MIGSNNIPDIISKLYKNYKITGCYEYNGILGDGFIVTIRPYSIPDDVTFFGGLKLIRKEDGFVSDFPPTADIDGLEESFTKRKISL